MAHITIVGGGVAGLTLAATLDPARFEVTLIERYPGRETVPTAFGIWPFALRALEQIDLADSLREQGLLLTSGVITGDSTRRSRSFTQREANTWLITRPGLLALLEQAVPDTVRRVHARIEAPAELDGDLVVAADGARSVVRREVWGDEPRDTGVVAIRGALPVPPDLPPDQMHEYWGEGMLFGVGPNPMAGGTGTNWYASTRRPEESSEAALDWGRRAYGGFPDLVRATLAAARPEDTLVNTILESRRPSRLVRDRYVLVGDAAHAMSPNLGRGAGESLVDAVMLGQALNSGGLPGVRDYERARLRPGQRTRVAAAALRRIALNSTIGTALVTVAAGLQRNGARSELNASTSQVS